MINAFNPRHFAQVASDSRVSSITFEDGVSYHSVTNELGFKKEEILSLYQETIQVIARRRLSDGESRLYTLTVSGYTGDTKVVSAIWPILAGNVNGA